MIRLNTQAIVKSSIIIVKPDIVQGKKRRYLYSLKNEITWS
jgi:hypothetical protein